MWKRFTAFVTVITPLVVGATNGDWSERGCDMWIEYALQHTHTRSRAQEIEVHILKFRQNYWHNNSSNEVKHFLMYVIYLKLSNARSNTHTHRDTHNHKRQEPKAIHVLVPITTRHRLIQFIIDAGRKLWIACSLRRRCRRHHNASAIINVMMMILLRFLLLIPILCIYNRTIEVFQCNNNEYIRTGPGPLLDKLWNMCTHCFEAESQSMRLRSSPVTITTLIVIYVHASLNRLLKLHK